MSLDDDVDGEFPVPVKDCHHYRLKYLGDIMLENGGRVMQGQCTDCGTSKIISDRYLKCGSQYIRKKG